MKRIFIYREGIYGQGQDRTADTRIFSPLAVAGLYVLIGRYWYLFKRLTVVSAGRFYRFEHIDTYSSFKAGGDWLLPLYLPFILDQSPIDRPCASLYLFTEGDC